MLVPMAVTAVATTVAISCNSANFFISHSYQLCVVLMMSMTSLAATTVLPFATMSATRSIESAANVAAATW